MSIPLWIVGAFVLGFMTLTGVKALRALRSRVPYVYAVWDGGALRAGKRLRPIGTVVKLIDAVLMVGLVGALVGDLLPAGWVRPAILSLCVQTLACELLLTEW